MRRRISLRGCVRLSVRPSIRKSLTPSLRRLLVASYAEYSALLTKTTISTSENASYAVYSVLSMVQRAFELLVLGVLYL